jgi:uncharacterized protein YuzE
MGKKMSQTNINYNETSDTRYMSFIPNVNATGIELNEHILLRIDKENRRAVGITFLNYSILTQKADFDARSFPLTGLTKLADETREIVMEILESKPVTEFCLFQHTHLHSQKQFLLRFFTCHSLSNFA